MKSFIFLPIKNKSSAISSKQKLEQTVEERTKAAVSKLDKLFLRELKKTIEANLSDPEFNVDALHKKLQMSQSTLYRKVHALTGHSPTEFIRSYRLKRGAQLLKKNSVTVLEVALETGFSSANYFTKCFKDKFQQLPSEFKAIRQ